MSIAYEARGGAAVGLLSDMDPWEVQLIRNVRLWCIGSHGQAQVWTAMTCALEGQSAQREIEVFEGLLSTIGSYAHRPMKTQAVASPCLGADEALLAHLVALASGGDLREAAQVAALLVTAAKAELVVLMAAQVGVTARTLAAHHQPVAMPDNVVRLH